MEARDQFSWSELYVVLGSSARPTIDYIDETAEVSSAESKRRRTQSKYCNCDFVNQRRLLVGNRSAVLLFQEIFP